MPYVLTFSPPIPGTPVRLVHPQLETQQAIPFNRYIPIQVINNFTIQNKMYMLKNKLNRIDLNSISTKSTQFNHIQ
jgi:hypothetical protein